MGTVSTAPSVFGPSRLRNGDDCLNIGVADPETARLGEALDVAKSAATWEGECSLDCDVWRETPRSPELLTVCDLDITGRRACRASDGNSM